MKKGFYSKLAMSGIKKNSRLYTPYILTCTGMVMMYYIITALSKSPIVKSLHGGETIASMLDLGSNVIAVFAMIFLFYTNSFLSRRRKKEFGLYNILGMGKPNIAKVLFCETLISGGISLLAGGILGVAFSKLAELGLVNILREKVSYELSVSWISIRNTAILFSVIFLLIFLNTLRHIHAAKPIELLHSENSGEKPPKANWFIGILGAVILAAAYYIAVTISNPLEALVWFFIAVIMVIISTYLLFISGSVLLCRILQKRRGYYYKPNHFVSVSSMVYRMKRNGAGLASICILATIVLVMISSTTSLYFSSEDSLRSRCPRDINVETQLDGEQYLSDDNIQELRNAVTSISDGFSAERKNILDYRLATVSGVVKDGVLETDVSAVNEFAMLSIKNIYAVYFIPLSDYNRVSGENETLGNGECLMYTHRKNYSQDSLKISGGTSLGIKRHIKSFAIDSEAMTNIMPSMYLVVSDIGSATAGLSELADFNGNRMLQYGWRYKFDSQLDAKKQVELKNALRDEIKNSIKAEKNGINYYNCESIEENRADFYGLYGSLFFLGILLSIVFICAAVLIIYYKQVSEGYEDEARFEIMQKVGMTKKEIRKSINSQLLTVFFMPLITAGIHLCFALPIVRKLLMLLNLNNDTLFIVTTAVSFAVFAVMYMIVYKITSNAYCAIVGGAKDK